MSRRISRDVKETIDELWERGIDASGLEDEIAEIIDERRGHYDAERDWEEVAERLGLL